MKSVVATSRDEIRWRRENNCSPDAKLFQLAYLGVWDSVGALGVPRQIPLLGRISERKYRFHDANLSSMVKSARHAVAIDERRRSFLPTNWNNIADLKANSPDGPDAYQEVYFLGDHGSVGGGGEITDLSNIALKWMIDGAREAGLGFDAKREQSFVCDPAGPLHNSKTPPSGLIEWMLRRKPVDRLPPKSIADVHETALARWTVDTKGNAAPRYRPKTLEPLATDIIAWNDAQIESETRIT